MGVTYTFRRNLSKYSRHALVTATCTPPMCSWSLPLTSSSHAIWKSPMNLVETAMSASCGHGRNQSMVHPLMSPGKSRARRENLSPTGEKHRHRCRLSRTRDRKKLHRLSYESTDPGGACFLNAGRQSFTSASCSSLGNSPATSPVMSSWLRYSKNASSFTSASVKMNATFWPFRPAILYSPFRSSNRFAWLYVLVIWIWNGNAPAMYAASRVKDCFPEPPTPMSSAEPAGCAMTREMRASAISTSRSSRAST